jgi:hypothetical protein
MMKNMWCSQHGYPLPCDKCGLEFDENSTNFVNLNGKLYRMNDLSTSVSPKEVWPEIEIKKGEENV